MKTEDFDYELPEHLIAQTPLKNRDESRLLVLDKKTGVIEHKSFKNIIDYLNKNDVLVLNDTKVLPARLIGVKDGTGAIIEILLLKEINDNLWECLVKPARKIKVGTSISFGGGILKARCIEEKEEGIRIFELNYNGIFYEILDKLGEMPLPPYIHKKLDNKNLYQTVYARNIGSSAAPTAGLHFTQELLTKIEDKGIKVVFITLHVGLGTFRPVNVDNISEHKMHAEYYMIDKQTAEVLNNAKEKGYSIISVGTTSARTLETVIKKYNKFIQCSGWTDIFIYPPYEFKGIDALMTNFHLPKSTLMMLISSFAERELILRAYNEAIKENYRFFSFGDSMIIK